MSKKLNIENKIEKDTSTISNVDFGQVLAQCFSRYAKYIIQDRALPDIRDGLKPVQRRILFAMYHLGLFPNTAFKKSARVVGEVIGKYHPHGDTSVYDALVRMSQPWKMNYPHVLMQGNNGSIDGDNAAAMRYTEVKLSEYAMNLLKDLDKPTVEYIDNFDGSEHEPTILPTWIPNLLANGASGISAGYATDIPPHNINEIIDAEIALIKKQSITLDDLLTIVKGPDFPTGGHIIKTTDMRSIYENGKGKVVIYADLKLSQIDKKFARGHQIEITAIPYDANKIDLIKQIYDVTEKIDANDIKEIYDASTEEEIKIIVEIRDQHRFDYLKRLLYSKTNLSKTVSVNMVGIFDRKPKTFNLIEYLKGVIAFQKEILFKKTKHEYENNLKRLEIITGLVKAVSLIDEIVKIVRHSKGRSEVIENLRIEFKFTEVQAAAIADLRLYRLSATDISELTKEKEELLKLTATQKEIIENPKSLEKELLSILAITKKQFVNNVRRTRVEENQIDLSIDVKEMIAKENVIISLTANGFLERNAYKPELFEAPYWRANDSVISKFKTTTLSTVVVISNKGYAYLIDAYKIHEIKKGVIASHFGDFTKLLPNEYVVASFDLEDLKDKKFIAGTKLSTIKKFTWKVSEEKKQRRIKVFSVSENDEIIWLQEWHNQPNIHLITKNKWSHSFALEEILETGFGTGGTRGFKLENNDEVISYAIDTNERLGIIDSKFNINWYSDLSEFKIKKRTNKPTLLDENKKTTYLGEMHASQLKAVLVYADSKLVKVFPKMPSVAELKKELETINSPIKIKSVN